MPTQDELLIKIVEQGAENVSKDLGTVANSLDKMSDSEKELLKTGEKSDKQNKSMVNGLADLKAGLDIVSNVGGKVVDFLKDAVEGTMAYDKSVRDLAQNLSITTEETSRIIQTADDFTVSQEAITSALQMAVKKGMKPSIDTLAKMADEYNAIADPTEKAARLTEVFGRNWTALTPMLKEGGAAIRAAAAAQDEALIVTEAQSKATRELEINMDNLGDKALALKLKIGNALVPVINQAADALGYLTDGVGSADSIENQLSRTVAQNVLWFGKEADVTKQSEEELRTYVTTKQNAITITDANDRALRRETEAVEASARESKNAETNLASFSSTVAASSQTFKDSYDKMYGAINLVTDAQGKLTTATLFAKASKDLDATAALELGLRLGVISNESVGALRALQDLRVKADSNHDGFIDAKEAADGYIDSVRGIAEAQKLIERQIDVTITTHRRVGGEVTDETTSTDKNARAVGGPVMAGVPYMVGEQGPEMYVPNQSGTIIPNNVTNTSNYNITTDRTGLAYLFERQRMAEARM